MSQIVIPEGIAHRLGKELKGYLYPITNIGYQLYVNIPGETDPQAQYWYEVRPGIKWESKCNRYAQKTFLPVMDRQMERLLETILTEPEFKPIIKWISF